MTAIRTTIQRVVPEHSAGLRVWVKRHPLASYFVLAYAGSWTVETPLVLSQRGFGWLALPEALLLFIDLVRAKIRNASEVSHG